MTYNLARAVGPALAAVAVRTLGIPAAFAINSGSYLVLVVGAAGRAARAAGAGRRGEARLRESLALVRERRSLLVFLLIVAGGRASRPTR